MTICEQVDAEKHDALSVKDPFRNYRYRDPMQHIAAILSIAKKPALLNHICSGAKINYPNARRYLSSLVQLGLLEIIEEKDRIYHKTRWKSKQRIYMTTEKGLEFLRLHKELDDLIHVGKTDLNHSARQQNRVKKFHNFLRKREQDLEAFETDEEVQIQVLVEGRKAVNLEDVRDASERKRTITVTLSHREYKLLKKEAENIKRSYPDLLRRMVRHYFGFKGSGCWSGQISKKRYAQIINSCTPMQ